MQKQFKDLSEGQRFRVVGPIIANSGQEAILTGGDHVLVKIPFMRNFYRTTGNKRNAKLKISTSRMNQKYFFIEDQQTVEVL